LLAEWTRSQGVLNDMLLALKARDPDEEGVTLPLLKDEAHTSADLARLRFEVHLSTHPRRQP
ncbi:MAG: hypothetical protein M3N93_09505, partial [Acidobacteriota bacterium]|nr:hypothetical protein [Acidobacteriota bacterium]